jgi:hypothetical protein
LIITLGDNKYQLRIQSRNMAIVDDTVYVSGNKMKLADMKRVLGDDISTFSIDVDEIQKGSFDVSVDKIRKIYAQNGCQAVGCEDTSFGTGVLAAMIKHVVDECESNEGDLYNVLRAIAPKRKYFDYTSILSFKNETYEAFFECRMKCEICTRSKPGLIDPFAIPVEYTLTQYVNGVKTVLCDGVKLDNPDKQSIAQQPDKRHLLHPRFIAVTAYKDWRTTI